MWWVGEIDEVETFAVWCDLVRKANTIIDIGANLGIYTLSACAVNPEATVVAFEPVTGTAEQLRLNVALNGWVDRCTVDEHAVTDHSGEALFYVPGDFSPIASLDPSGFRGKTGTATTVRVGTLDELVSRPVDLVKIDVEKFEPAVLRGMSRILADDRPAIIVECLPDGPGSEVEAILHEAGYQLFQLKADGPEPVDGIQRHATEEYRNFLATPQPRATQ